MDPSEKCFRNFDFVDILVINTLKEKWKSLSKKA